MDECCRLGEYLREKRQEKGLTLEEISSYTKVRLDYLQALEENNYDQLPAETYLKGFLTTYAETLDLPPADILELYRVERPVSVKSELKPPTFPLAEKSFLAPFDPKLLTVILLLMILLAGGGLWWVFSVDTPDFVEDETLSIPSVEEPIAQPTVPAVVESETISISPQAETLPFKETVAELPVIKIVPNVSEVSIADVPKTVQPQKEVIAVVLPAAMELKAIQPVTVQVAIDGRPVQTYSLHAESLLRWRIRRSVELQVDPLEAVQVRLADVVVAPDDSGRFVFPTLED